MEILLNAYFTNPDPEAMVGSFLGSGYVNNHEHTFSSPIERGQAIGHSINDFIDNHPVCQQSIQLLSPKARKYGRTILKLYYDHFLARNWQQHSDIPYDQFCHEIVEVLKSHNHLFPYKPKRVVNRVIRKNLVSTLPTINGLNEYIREMTRYNSYNSSILESIGDLVKNYNSFSKDFDLIFPEMERECAPLYGKVLIS
jgi:acyl carrier protein phosphodiesterase